LGRVYWFTVEFGLIRERSQLKIYGAGILSSGGETPYALSEIPSHLPFDIAHIMASSYRQDVFQEKYFVIDSYEQLYDSIGQMKNTLKQMLRANAILS
jgi:phenylalanine-4-hydroxylase